MWPRRGREAAVGTGSISVDAGFVGAPDVAIGEIDEPDIVLRVDDDAVVAVRCATSGHRLELIDVLDLAVTGSSR